MNASPDMVMTGGMGVVGCVIMALVAVLALASFAFWLWMLIDAITKMPSGGNTKLIWILVLVFTGVIGALIYYFVQRPKNPPKT
jgi:peptidoglycan/LPS O-acetylase OafA/YrhL